MIIVRKKSAKFQIKDKKYLSAPNVRFHQTPNVGASFEVNQPSLIILHYTATRTLKEAELLLADPAREVSSHLVIDRDGSIVQMCSFAEIAWHAGKSSWKGRESLNKFSIGIELVNFGKLTKDKSGNANSWNGISVPKKEQFLHSENGENSVWHKYTRLQIECCINVCQTLKKTFTISEILGHSDISPSRKIDPGPAFCHPFFDKNTNP